MADAMVTGRMPQAKKQAGGRVLQSLGLSASQVINQLYDYLITYERLPLTLWRTSPPNPCSSKKRSPLLVACPAKISFRT